MLLRACETQGTFAAFCKSLRLTDQRSEKLRLMHRDLLTSDGLWTIPTEDREKGNAEYIRLSPMVMQIIRKQPTSESAPYIFQGRLKGPINGFTKDKAALRSEEHTSELQSLMRI